MYLYDEIVIVSHFGSHFEYLKIERMFQLLDYIVLVCLDMKIKEKCISISTRY